VRRDARAGAQVRLDRSDGQHPHAAGTQGRAVQVDPIKPRLEAPGTKRLKLKYNHTIKCFQFCFNFAFNQLAPLHQGLRGSAENVGELRRQHQRGRAGHYGRAVQVDPIKPTLKAPGTKRLKP
jgi:hypothetical protein